MKFTVITVTYNCASVLEDTIKSVLAQDYPDIEYIIIDGKSTDGTLDIIERYKDRITKIVSEPDKGIYDAMNKGIMLATGDYINFMNAGDRFASPDVLTQVAATNPTATILYGDTRVNERGVSYIVRANNLEPMMAKRLPFCHQSAFVGREYHASNPFDLTFRCSADYNLFYNAYFRDKATFAYVPILIADYEETDGFSKTNISRTHRERYRIWGIENNKPLVFKLEIELFYRRLMERIKRAIPLSLLRVYRSK